MINRIHFIAIGGAAMHNLALALQSKGFRITGSDDEINEPSLSRLKEAGLLPEKIGWFPEKIDKLVNSSKFKVESSKLEEECAVILGMHARADNPELIRAQQLGVRIYSYPEYLYEFSKNKNRVVIGGSHGKTTITSMILHVLRTVVSRQSSVVSEQPGNSTYDLRLMTYDYMVGAKVEGFDTMVKLSDAPVIILEGDEYLSSPIDRRPKFHLYKANIALLSGIAWDHVNVFPTYQEYFKQFQIYIDELAADSTLVYNAEDAEVQRAVEQTTSKCKKIAYHYLEQHPPDPLQRGNGLQIFGKHNMSNAEGARIVCALLGVEQNDFYKAISTFKGAARRLELVSEKNGLTVYKDFAHSPSKVKATIEAVKEQFSNKNVIACLELHTFSSLTEKFLMEYKSTMDKADEAIVYFNPHTIEHKKLPPINDTQVKAAFARNDLKVISSSAELRNYLSRKYHNDVLLMMSSGTFDGLDFNTLQ